MLFRSTRNVSGAGDTFLVALAIYHTLTNNIAQAIKFANKCAAIVVQKKATYALQPGDFKQKTKIKER